MRLTCLFVIIFIVLAQACTVPDAEEYYERDSDSLGKEAVEATENVYTENTQFFELTQSANGIKTYTFKTNDTAYIVPEGKTVTTITGTAPATSASVTVLKRSGSPTAGYGIIFFYNKYNSKEYMMIVMINTRRQYMVAKISDGTSVSIQDWTSSSSLRGGFGVQNTISISHASNGIYSVKFNGTQEMIFTDPSSPVIPYGTTGYVVSISPTEGFPKKSVEVTFTE